MTQRAKRAPPPEPRSPAPKLGPTAQRTRTRILETARTLFLDRGFGGTSIEEISAEAGVSRTSFWTYFPSKLDVLRALGAQAESDGLALTKTFQQFSEDVSMRQVAAWVGSYLAFLDEHGGFIYAAFQAGYSDPEIRAWSESATLQGAQELGRGLVRLRAGSLRPGKQATAEGLIVLSMMERSWYHWRVGKAPFDKKTMINTIAGMIWQAPAATPQRA